MREECASENRPNFTAHSGFDLLACLLAYALFQYFNAGGNLIKASLSLRVEFMGLLHFGGLVVVFGSTAPHYLRIL